MIVLFLEVSLNLGDLAHQVLFPGKSWEEVMMSPEESQVLATKVIEVEREARILMRRGLIAFDSVTNKYQRSISAKSA